MRVTHIITRLIVGGAQENTISTVLGLRERKGVEALLVSGPTTGPEGSLEPEVPGSVLAIVPSLTRPVHPWKDIRALQQITRLLGEQRPDIVHTHSGKAGVLGRLAAARAGVNVRVHTIHGPSFGPFQGSLANWIFRSAEAYAARYTTQFVSVADAMTRQYLGAGIGAADRYTTIRSGFDLEPFLEAKNDAALRARYGIGPSDFVVGKIARLFKLKGHDDLFAIAPQLVRERPQTRFLLVGDGAWRSRFEQRAAALGLQRHFVFTGLVAPREVPKLVGIMDALAHLSLREGLARSLPQALAAGRPVIAYDCDGAREVCREDETGFLIRPGDLATLAERLRRLADDPVLRERLGRRGRELTKQEFGVDYMIDCLYDLYVHLLADSGERRHRGPAAP